MAATQDSDSAVTRPAPPPSPRLLAEVAATRPVTTRRPARTAVGIALVSLACGLSLLVWGIGLRRDLGALPALPLVLYAAACLVSFTGQLAAAVVPPRREVLPSRRRAARVALASLAIVVPLGLLVGVNAHAGTPIALGHFDRFWARTLPCFGSGLAVAAVPALIGLWALRRLVPHGAWPMAMAVGGAGGVLAGLVLELHCPRADLVHVGLAHGTVMVIPALLLAVVGSRLLSE
jgi:hypothetical protein